MSDGRDEATKGMRPVTVPRDIKPAPDEVMKQIKCNCQGTQQ